MITITITIKDDGDSTVFEASEDRKNPSDHELQLSRLTKDCVMANMRHNFPTAKGINDNFTVTRN